MEQAYGTALYGTGIYGGGIPFSGFILTIGAPLHVGPLHPRKDRRMAKLPLIRDTLPGLYHVCVSANTDYAVVIPATARGVILWFEAGASDSTMVPGRIGVDEADTAVSGITGTDDALGYHPAIPVEYTFEQRATRSGGAPGFERDVYLHVASATAGSVVRGMWLYSSDTV